MATSVVAICNRALDLIGQSPIASLTDPTNTAAACLRNYDQSRDAVLRSYPWNSATRRVALPALSAAPAWGFARKFQLPVDCLRVLDSEGDLHGTRWRREGNTILTDAGAPLRLRYIARVADPAELDPMLSDLIALHLASQIAYLITGSNEVSQRMAATYDRLHRDARAMDAREMSQDEELHGGTWLGARVSSLAGARQLTGIPASSALSGAAEPPPGGGDFLDY
jgi:hypothetical protein